MWYNNSNTGIIRKKEGFTLIELLVVIAIIGLLATVVLIAVGTPRKAARDARRKYDIRQVSLAMDLCYDDIDCGPGAMKYPTNSLPDQANAIANIDIDKDPCYLCPLPIDPLNSGDQMYKWSKNEAVPDKYCLYTKLENEDVWVAASEKGTKMDLPAKPPTTLSSSVSCW